MNHQDTFENEFLGNFSYQNAVALNLNQPLPSTNNNILESNFFTRNDSNLDLEKDDTRAGLSRHVSSVISHFTSSKDGFGRLLNEMDDFIHCVTAKLEFLYASPSCNKAVGYSQDEIFGSPLKDVVHQDDWIFFVEYIQNSFDTQQEFLTHCRYISKTGNIKLMEIRGKPFTAAVDDTASNKIVVHLVLSAREYASKSATAFDSIVDLQIMNLGLKKRLEKSLLNIGRDPCKNIHLNELLEGEDVIDSFLHHPSTIAPQMFQNPGMMMQGSPIPRYDPDIVAPNNSPTSTQALLGAQDTDKKRRKRKVPVGDLFCLQCGSTKSPEWRTGPEGPKTLCNACGLAYYKKNKKLTEAQKKAEMHAKD